MMGVNRSEAPPRQQAKLTWRMARSSPIVCALGVIAGILLICVVFRISCNGSGEQPRRAAPLSPARVVLAIDLSESMACPLELAFGEECTRELRARADRTGRLTRIMAAAAWSVPAIADLDQPDDKVSLWVFKTSDLDNSLPESEPVLSRIVSLDSTPSPALVRKVVAGLRVTRGGTPLYDMIETGLQYLQGSSSPNNAINSLVILTDGGQTRTKASLDQLKRALAVADATNPVRVLLTAAGEAQCQQLLPLVERFDGDCFRATTRGELYCARRNIRQLLRTPQPPRPRTAERRRGRDC